MPCETYLPPSVEFRASRMLYESYPSQPIYFLSSLSLHFNICLYFCFLAKSSGQCQPLGCHLSPSRGCRTAVIRIHMAPPRGESLEALAPWKEGRKEGWKHLIQCHYQL